MSSEQSWKAVFRERVNRSLGAKLPSVWSSKSGDTSSKSAWLNLFSWSSCDRRSFVRCRWHVGRSRRWERTLWRLKGLAFYNNISPDMVGMFRFGQIDAQTLHSVEQLPPSNTVFASILWETWNNFVPMLRILCSVILVNELVPNLLLQRNFSDLLPMFNRWRRSPSGPVDLKFPY